MRKRGWGGWRAAIVCCARASEESFVEDRDNAKEINDRECGHERLSESGSERWSAAGTTNLSGGGGA